MLIIAISILTNIIPTRIQPMANIIIHCPFNELTLHNRRTIIAEPKFRIMFVILFMDVDNESS